MTEYSILVQPFNSKGTGPKSVELALTTREDGIIVSKYDSSMLISMASSLFVLFVGFVAVLSLLMYKRKLDKRLTVKQHHHRKPSATSAASTVHTEVSSAVLMTGDQLHRTPTSLAVSRLNREKHALPPLPSEEKANRVVVSSLHPRLGQQNENNTTNSDGSSSAFNSSSPRLLRGRLPKVPIPRKQLDDFDNKDLYSEYGDITPYATFTLTDDMKKKEDGLDDDDREFKTFTVSFGEPAYNFKVSPDTRFMFTPVVVFFAYLSIEYKGSSRLLNIYVRNNDPKTCRLRQQQRQESSTGSHARVVRSLSSCDGMAWHETARKRQTFCIQVGRSLVGKTSFRL